MSNSLDQRIDKLREINRAREISKQQRTRRLLRNNAIEKAYRSLFNWIDSTHPTRDAHATLTQAFAQLRVDVKEIN